MSSDSANDYIPALRFRWLTRFYDQLLASTLKEEKFKSLLVEQTRLAPEHTVLDLGCGTGTLTILLKRSSPRAQVIGLDGDPAALAIARRKAAEAAVDVEMREGMSFDLPFEDASFDRVVSSLVFHHLTTANKRRTLAEVRRVLRPRGELHVADWGEARSLVARLAFLSVQLLDGFETTSDNVRGRLATLFAEAGFRDVSETHREATLFGTLALYSMTSS